MANDPSTDNFVAAAHRWGAGGAVLFVALAVASPFEGGATGFSFVVNAWATVAVFALVASIVVGRWHEWRPLMAEVVIAGAAWAVLNEVSQAISAHWVDRGVQFGSAMLVGYLTGSIVGLAVETIRSP
jgi:prepilin signal peptidase PulO-like enzyme (type II secretory pathway)